MTSNKPRVLIIDNSIDVTGALKAIVSVTKALAPDFDFHFLLPGNSKATRIVGTVSTLNMKEISKSFSAIFFYLPFLFLNALQLKRILKERQIDLVHVNDIFNLLPPVARILGSQTPYIVHVRFLPDRFPPTLFKFWFRLHRRHASAIVVVSEAVKKQLPIDPKIICIPDGMLEGKVSEPGPPVHRFLYLSNFIRGKGQDHALAAFKLIHNQIPGWKLRFVGGDMGLEKNKVFLEEIRTKAQQFGLADKIEWNSFVDDVEYEYRNADIVTNFSESESFSMTCLEALFHQKPLIATDCGGPSEIIGNEDCGVLVPNKDVTAMASVMVKLALDPDLASKLGRNGYERVRKRYSISTTASQLKEVYLSALRKI